jgi:ATP-dependent RNA helicase MSS116
VKRNPDNYKMMIFLVSAVFTSFMADLARSATDLFIEDMHSKKTQAYREHSARNFSRAKKAVLFTSDVSARGVDYPNVTLVMQIGSTERDPYIHRLGRTARAATGLEGRGLLITSPEEKNYMMK